MSERLHCLISYVLIAFVCVFGLWNIGFWILVLGFDSSFYTLGVVSIFTVLTGLIVAYRLRNALATELQKSPATPYRGISSINVNQARIIVLSVVATTSLYCLVTTVFTDSSTVFYNIVWALACTMSGIVLLFWKPAYTTENAELPMRSRQLEMLVSRLDPLFFLLSLGLALYLTATTIRPDADDAYYLHLALSTLANPNLPLLAQDLLLNTGAHSLIHPSYQIVSYEVLVALASELTGLDVLTLYYNIFPLIAAAVWACAGLMLLQATRLKLPGMGLLITTVLLVVWGGDPHSFGNFAFVRLFQGKAVLAMLAAPLIFTLTIAYCKRPDKSRWSLLLLGVCSLAGLTSSALFIVPFALFLAAILGTSVYGIDRVKLVGLLGATLPVIAIVFVAFTLTSHSVVSVIDSGDIEVSGESFGGLDMKYIMLLATIALAIAARQLASPYSRVFLVVLACIGILAVFPPAIFEWPARLLGINLLSWRLQWSFPTVFIVGLLGAASVQMLWEPRHQGTWRMQRVLPLVVFAAIISAVGLLGTSTMAFSLYPPGNALLPKIEPTDYDRAKAIASYIPSGAYVAAGRMDEFLPRLLPDSTYVSVRHYLAPYEGFLGEETYHKRLWLQEILTTQATIERDGKLLDAKWAANTAENLEVTAIIFDAQDERDDARDGTFASTLSFELQTLGYYCNSVRPASSIVCIAGVEVR